MVNIPIHHYAKHWGSSLINYSTLVNTPNSSHSLIFQQIQVILIGDKHNKCFDTLNNAY